MKNFFYYINFQNTRFLDDVFNLSYFLDIAISIYCLLAIITL